MLRRGQKNHQSQSRNIWSYLGKGGQGRSQIPLQPHSSWLHSWSTPELFLSLHLPQSPNSRHRLGSINLSRILETQIPQSPQFEKLWAHLSESQKPVLTSSLGGLVSQSFWWSFLTVHAVSVYGAQNALAGPGRNCNQGLSLTLHF